MPINIVRHKEFIRAAAAPLLAYHGGKLLQNVEVTLIYWGSAWANDPLRTSLDEFFAFVLTSPLIEQLAEYGPIGHGKLVQSLWLGNNEPPNPVDDTQIQFELQTLISQGTVGAPTSNSLYFVFTPSGTTVTIQGQSSCQDFCGYHNFVGNIVYAVDPYDDCPGCQFVPGDLVGSTTVPASHELCEAITDPFLNGWFDDGTGEEIGDICAGQTKVLNASSGPPGGSQSYAISVQPSQAIFDGKSPISLLLSLMPSAALGAGTGQAWTAQKEWSNTSGSCV
jgi:hypothetical protein